MSWQELERLVDNVESDGVIRRAMKHCRSRHEFVLAARRLGYRITRLDLRLAFEEEQREHARAGRDQHPLQNAEGMMGA